MNSRRFRALTAILAVVLVASLTGTTSALAAFVATTMNTGNTVTAASSWGIGALNTWGNTGDWYTAPNQYDSATTYTSVAAGDRYVCGLRTGGSLWCWGGANGSGQTGNTAGTIDYTPYQVTGSWSQVATGSSHTCGIRSDSALLCWGNGGTGRLGIGNTTNYPVPQAVTAPAATGWASVSAGNALTCALRTDSTLYCWGKNDLGETGSGTTTNPQSTPIAVSTPSATGWTKVMVGYQHACALRTDQTMYCWGDGGSGRLGVASGNTSSYPAPQAVSGGYTWTTLGVGTDHTCGVRTGGTLWCWGVGSDGRLGNGTTQRTVPTQVGTGTTWRSVTGGRTHTCGTQTDGSLWCWGNNQYGQLGLSDGTSRSAPFQVGTATDWSPADGNGPVTHQTCMTRTTGTVWCWGQTGNMKWTPGQIGTATTWRSVSVGAQSTCGVQSAGSLWCWGQNGNGQLGLGDTTYRVAPVQVTGTTWKQATSGTAHSCAVRTDGTLYCWGLNDNGQLGLGTSGADATTPQQVTSPDPYGWDSVSAGTRFSCGLRTGTLWCWGQNTFGQAGQGTNTNPQATPVQVTTPAATGWVSVATGFQHACGLRTDGTIHCWGDGGGGRLGIGSTLSHNSPQKVTGSDWWILATGTDHTCAIKISGQLWCWGVGSYGRLGFGTFADQTTPKQVGTATDWRTITGGNVHTCALRSNGALWCWGGNMNGQLGLGAGVANQPSPVQVTASGGRPIAGGPDSGAGAMIVG